MIKNIFADLPQLKSSPAEIFETLAQGASCRLERIISIGHTTPAGEWYDQDWDEWVLVLRGEARLQIDGESQERTLREGDYLLLSAHQRHRVTWTDPSKPTVWLVLHMNA